MTESGSWTPEEVMITVATSLHDDTPAQINLIETLGQSVRNSKNYCNVYWLLYLSIFAYWKRALHMKGQPERECEDIGMVSMHTEP